MPTLHGTPFSPFARKVLIALSEKGVAFDHVPVSHFELTEAFDAISPLRKIPVWTTDGGDHLPDSSAILQYLDRVYPMPRLIPEDPLAAAQALFLEEYGDTALALAVAPVFIEMLAAPVILKRAPDQALIDKKLSEEVPRVFSYLNSRLEGREYLVGGDFSIADIGIASPLCNFRHTGNEIDRANYPYLADFADRMLQRPTITALFANEQKLMEGMVNKAAAG